MKLKNHQIVKMTDTVKVERNGRIDLTDSTGFLFYRDEGVYQIGEIYRKENREHLRSLRKTDSVTQLYTRLGLAKCDSINRPVIHNWQERGSTFTSSVKWEIDVTVTGADSFTLQLRWTDLKTSYFIIGRNIFGEMIFIEKSNTNSHFLKLKESDSAYMIRILTTNCESSEVIGFKNQNGIIRRTGE